MSSCSCPVFRPSLEEFRDFQGFLDKVEDEAYEYGILKIVPPEGWWLSSKQVEEKCDVDGEFGLCEIGNPVEQTVFGNHGVFEVAHEMKGRMSIRRLRERGAERPSAKGGHEARESRSLRGSSGSEYEQHEKRFWQSLTTTSNGALYGADEPCLSVFKRLAGEAGEGAASDWFLDSMDHDPLRKACPDLKLGGVTEPMLYVGSWRALFAWHIEDANLYSINLLHFGAPKSWYAISPRDATRFERFAAKQFPHAANACPAFLRHKMSIMSPKLLRENGFEVSECVHMAGEIIVTLPEAYHAGFNHGFNVAESTNFATHRWPQAGRRATVCCCQPNAVRLDVESIARKIEGREEEFAVDDDVRDPRQKDDLSQCDIVDVQDGWGRLHVKGARRSTDTWVKLNEVSSRIVDTVPQVSKRRRKMHTPNQRRRRCGECDGCTASACGTCIYCLDSKSMGGPCKLKK